MTSSSSPLRGAVLALIAFCAYACCDVSIKALGQGLNTFEVMFLSAACTLPFVLAQIVYRNRSASLVPRLPWLTAARVVITLVGGAMVTYSFTHLPLAQCYAVFFTMPLMITVLAWPMLGEPIDPLRGVIVLVGFGGVLIALQPGSTTFHLAHLTAIGGAMTGAVNSLLLRKIGHRETSGVILLYPVVFQLLASACFLPFVWQPIGLNELRIGLQLGALGTIGGLALIAAYRIAPAIVVAPMQYSQIFWASILGFIFFAEVPGRMTAIGIAVIIAAGLALLLVAARAPQTRSQAA
jgi:S-adenosylmethionine uptake transporter